MEYKILEKPKPFSTLDKIQRIGVRKSYIHFHRGFVKKFGIKRYCILAENSSHHLCFRLSDTEELNAYRITESHQPKFVLYVMSTPFCIRNRVAEFGNYKVRQDGDWFVTECKLE